ncbi:MAG: exosortase-associated EpsI family protein, partial [Kiritimatiellaceae bacterium]|nr:exosortase-associated EpsI family protein [Kiritimatiellaceae bacterium]
MKFSYRHYLVFVLLIAAALFVHLHEDLAVPVNQPLENIPVQLGQWRMIDQSQFDEETLSVLKPT